MTDANRRENALRELEAAREALRAAEALLGLGLLRDASSRAYYAAFHGARAMLMSRGLQAKTHAGLLHVVNDQLVRGGAVAASVNDALTDLLALRATADDGHAFTMSPAAVAAKVELAREVVEVAARLIG